MDTRVAHPEEDGWVHLQQSLLRGHVLILGLHLGQDAVGALDGVCRAGARQMQDGWVLLAIYAEC